MSVPDANIHPVATGSAKPTVDAHQDSQPIKLYAGWFCPFVQRTWATLEEKKIPYQYIEVNPYHKPESLLKLNPRGLVPTLEYEGKPLFESNVICELLEEAYPDHSPNLLPKDLYTRARMRIWQDFITSRLLPAFHRFLQYQPKTKSFDDEGLSELRNEFHNHLKTFVNEMDPTGPFFLGPEPALVDLVIAPWALRLWIFDEFKHGTGIPEPGNGGADEATWERFRKWQKAIESRPSIVNTTSEKEHYMPIYKRYADDQAQSELAKAMRSGKGVP